MKTISKIFGAFAAVALFAACSSEEALELPETEVPAGMHKVTLTVNKDQAKQMVGKKRIHMNDANGDFLWDDYDKIAVVYADNTIWEFNWQHTQEDNGKVAYFTGYVPETTFANSHPTDVYSDYMDEYHQDKSNYTQVGYKQFNIVNFDENFLMKRGSHDYINTYGIHLHGTVEGTTNMEEFAVTLSLDHAAMVRIAKENLPTNITGNKVTVKVGSIEYGAGDPVEYTIYGIDENNDGHADEDLTFFVEVHGGLTNAQITVEGSTHTFHTAWDTDNKMVKTIQPGKRYNLTPSMYALVYNLANYDGSIYYDGSDYATVTWEGALNSDKLKYSASLIESGFLGEIEYKKEGQTSSLYSIGWVGYQYSWGEALNAESKIKPEYAPVYNRRPNNTDIINGFLKNW